MFISLISKEGDLRDLNYWRPITLLIASHLFHLWVGRNGPRHPEMRNHRMSKQIQINAQAFKTHLTAININFIIQPIPILSQHEPYVYLEINLVSSLQWKTQTHVTTTKLINQYKLLTSCPITMKQKIQMVDTVIRAGIAYSFYVVPYSLHAIKKLDKRIIALHKNVCGLPKCLSNAVTQRPQICSASKLSP